MGKQYVVVAFMILALSACTAEDTAQLQTSLGAPVAPETEPSPEPCAFDDLALNGSERFDFQGAYRIIWDAPTSYWLMLSMFEDGHSAYAVNQGAGYIEDGRSSLTDTWTRMAGCKVEYRLANGTLRFTLQDPVVDEDGLLISVNVVDHAASGIIRSSSSVLHMDYTACQGVF
jgi:hypothetical protein